MAEELFGVMERVEDATQAVLDAQQQARAAGQIERLISLQLVMRSQQDAMLAMAELLESEGTPYPPPPGGGPKGGRPAARGRVEANGAGW
jgi:hypothetical protein